MCTNECHGLTDYQNSENRTNLVKVDGSGKDDVTPLQPHPLTFNPRPFLSKEFITSSKKQSTNDRIVFVFTYRGIIIIHRPPTTCP
jgi:hypothetical protein